MNESFSDADNNLIKWFQHKMKNYNVKDDEIRIFFVTLPVLIRNDINSISLC